MKFSTVLEDLTTWITRKPPWNAFGADFIIIHHLAIDLANCGRIRTTGMNDERHLRGLMTSGSSGRRHSALDIPPRGETCAAVARWARKRHHRESTSATAWIKLASCGRRRELTWRRSWEDWHRRGGQVTGEVGAMRGRVRCVRCDALRGVVWWCRNEEPPRRVKLKLKTEVTKEEPDISQLAI